MEDYNKADSTREEIAKMEPVRIDGLYFNYHGEKMTPSYLWFGIDLHTWLDRKDCNGGECYIHYDNALHPVHLPDGKQLVMPDKRNVSADYKNGVICNFHRE